LFYYYEGNYPFKKLPIAPMAIKLNLGQIYTLRKDVNGQNEQVPNDMDFQQGTQVQLHEVNKDNVIVSDSDFPGQLFSCDKKEFIASL
jgi:hypothetical protein